MKTPKKAKRRKHRLPAEDAMNAIKYIWRLNSYLGLNPDREMGQYRRPEKVIGEGLTSEFVVRQLNSAKCFDFDYQPKEGDCLLIYDGPGFASRLEFIYRGNEWVEDYYDPFMHKDKEIYRGVIKESNAL